MLDSEQRPYLNSYKHLTESGFLVSPLDGMRQHRVCDGPGGDTAQCARWAAEVPADANVGVQIPRGLIVVTVDVEEHGPLALWTAREKRGVAFPRTLVAQTARGGLQIWFYAEPVDAPHSKPMPGVYVSSHPRVVPVPPSVGANGVAMRWLNQHRVADLPEGLHDPLGVRAATRRPTFVDCMHAPPVSVAAAKRTIAEVLGPLG